jgi:hypothetical protein
MLKLNNVNNAEQMYEEYENQLSENKLNINNEFIAIKFIDESDGQLEIVCKQFGTYTLNIYKQNVNTKLAHSNNKYLMQIDLRCELPTGYGFK